MTVEFSKDLEGVIIEVISGFKDGHVDIWPHNYVVDTRNVANYLPECWFKFKHLDRLEFTVK